MLLFEREIGTWGVGESASLARPIIQAGNVTRLPLFATWRERRRGSPPEAASSRKKRQKQKVRFKSVVELLQVIG
jgi:hypothetical protein